MKYISARKLAAMLGVPRNKILAALHSGRIRSEKVEVTRVERRIPYSELSRVRQLMQRGAWDWGKRGRPRKHSKN